jgi:ParB-like chromosome segregation protein Spo0J
MIGEDEIKHIPLSDIFADEDFNARSKADTLAETSELNHEGTGIGGLITSLSLNGQDDPVIVRRIVNGKSLKGKKVTQPYELIAGFRRYAAFVRINNSIVRLNDKKVVDEGKRLVPNTPDGTIRAVVRELTEAQARSLNLRENTARNDIDTPDLVFGVREMHYDHKMTAAEIASELGKSLSYATVLVRISSINRKVLEHWRLGGEFEGIPSAKKVPVADMDELSKVDPSRQIEEYKRLLAGRTNQEDKDNQRIEAAKKRAETLGKLLGKLVKAEFITEIDEEKWFEAVELMVKTGKRAFTRADLKKIVTKAKQGFEAGLEYEEEETEEEETPAKSNKKN